MRLVAVTFVTGLTVAADTVLRIAPARAQDATWLATPVNGDYNNGANWSTGTVPTGMATFGSSSVTTFELTAPGLTTSVGGWTFNAGAPNYTFFNLATSQHITFTGAGIVINGGSVLLETSNGGGIEFQNGSSAGSASILGVGSTVSFGDTSTAADATIVNQNSFLGFSGNASAGNASIFDTDRAILQFSGNSTAANATITITGPTFVAGTSSVNFTDTSTAGSSIITGDSKSAINFTGNATAGNSTITNNNVLTFVDNSSGGMSTITNNAQLIFNDTSDAGSGAIVNNNRITFNDQSSAGGSHISNNGIIGFTGNSNGSNATITNSANAVVDLSGSAGFLGDGKLGIGTLLGSGNVYLGSNELTVANGNGTFGGVISDCGAGGTACANSGATGGALVKSGSGVMTLTNANTYTGGTTVRGGTLQLGDATHAGSIIGSVAVTTGGIFSVVNADTSGITSITNSGVTQFQNNTTASTANITNNVLLNFIDNSTAGNASITNNAGGTVNFSNSSGPNGDHKLSAGSIAGAGNFILGANQLTAGANNLSTEVSGIISGAGGSLVKTGTGTLILSGDNTYTGGTAIVGGTLQLGNGGTSGSIAGNVVDNSVLAFDRSDTLTIAGAISGTGTVQQIGSGTTILTGANTYTGGTTITSGTLQIGDGNTTGSIVGDVLNNGALAFNRSDNIIFSGAILGNGAVRQIGSGTTILTGTSTYAGGTTITNGTLQLGNGGTTGSITGDVINNGALAFDRSDMLTFAGAISGNGTLRQISTGKTVLTGDSSAFTGATSVESGTLAVNGLLGGSIDVQAQGRLQGIGTIGDTSVSGTIAPGNSIGTINVAGDIAFNPGSVYEVEVNAAGQSDKIAATGAATINGASVRVLAGAGNYMSGAQYTILSAAGGITGTFTGGVSSNMAFFDSALSYDANNAYLTMTRNGVSFASVGITPNQIATGSGVESLGGGALVHDAILNLSVEQARHAFDQLSGEIHASLKTALIEDSRFIRSAVDDRIRTAFGAAGASGGTVVTYVDSKPQEVAATTDRTAVWGQAFGSWGHTDGNGNAAHLDRSIGGFFVGADTPVLDTWRLGAVAGYSRTSFNVNSRQSSGSSDNYHVGLYGGTQWGNLGFRTGAAYAWHDISTSRTVMLPDFSDRLKAIYNAGTAQIFGEFGYGVHVGRFAFEPFANIAYVNLHSFSFTESGGAAALTGASANTDTTYTTLGAHASANLAVGDKATSIKGTIGWRHAYGDVTPLSTMRFAGGGETFGIIGVPITRDAAVVEGGLDFALAHAATLGVSYGGQFGSGFTDQSVKATFNVKF